MWWVALACRSPDPLPPPRLVDQALAGPEDDRVGLVQIWTGHTSRPVAVALTLEGGGETRVLPSPRGTDHRVALLGLLPGTAYEVRAEAAGVEFEALSFDTEEPPAAPFWPTIDVLNDAPGRVEPGWTMIPLGPQNVEGGAVLVLDEEQRLRWWYVDREEHTYDAVPDGVGGVWIRLWSGVRHVSWDGRPLATFAFPADDPDEIEIEAGRIDHELLPDGEGGFWTFAAVAREQPVPVDYGTRHTAPGTVEDTPLVHVGADGSTVAEFPISPLLDPARVSWDGLATALTGGADFVHANAAIPFDDGGAMVSTRSQDAVLRLEADGSIRWILGDPAGWGEAWQGLFLRPLGAEDWPYHQHGIHWVPEDQLLLLFDNHPFGSSPYGPQSADPARSRAVGYRIDDAARTAERVWETDATATGPMYSPVLGEVQPLPVTGNRLIVYGSLRNEGTVVGWGVRTARILEVDPEDPDPAVLELRLRVDADDVPEGIWVYRAERGLPAYLVR